MVEDPSDVQRRGVRCIAINIGNKFHIRFQ